MIHLSLLPSLPPSESSAESHYAYGAEQPAASSSIPAKPLCAMCTHQYSKYACPGCYMRTCSATCSSSHKAKTGCTGTRNKVSYIPMNEFSWGKMMDDYVFLEDMGRKVGDWGKEIVRGGYMVGTGAHGRGDVRGRARGTRGGGRGRGHTGKGGSRTKRDILKMQLEARNIDLELLPVGMERRKINQSTWDFKNQTALMTLKFIFHKPKDPLAPSSQPREPPFTMLTHKNDTKLPLISLLRAHIHDTKKESSHPEWVKRLVYPDPDVPDLFSHPHCVMPAQLNPLLTRDSPIKKAHYSFDPTQPLIRLLRHTQFVEFPTVEVWEQFEGAIINAEGVMLQQEAERPHKKRKMNPQAGKLAIAGLLGGYGSDEEEVEQPKNVLEALDDYAASDEDIVGDSRGMGDVANDLVNADISDDDDTIEVDPAVLLQLMRAAGAGGSWTVDDDDDAVDWGEVDEGQI